MTYEEFLEHAEECERLAEAAALPSNRLSLLSAAEMWRRMAADTKPHDGAGRDDSKIGDPRSDT
jgi:hypothetical protein